MNNNSRQNTFSNTENVIERPKVTDAVASERQIKDVCKEREDLQDNSDDLHTRLEEKKGQHADTMTQQDIENLCSSLSTKLKSHKTTLQQETAVKTNPFQIRKNIKIGRVDKNRKTVSLRRQALLNMMKNKGLFKTYKRSKNELKTLQDKKSITAGGGKVEMKNETSESFVTNITGIQVKPTFPNKSKLVLKEKTKASCDSQPTSSYAPDISYATFSAFQSPTVKSRAKVWAHFICYLQLKESYDCMARDYFESTQLANQTSKSPMNTNRSSINKNLEYHVKTVAETATNQQPENVRSESSETEDANSKSVLKFIQHFRLQAVEQTAKLKEVLDSKIADGHRENIIGKKIEYMTSVKDLKSRFHKFFDVLCNHPNMLHILKRTELDLSSANDDLKNSSSLTDLPMSERQIRTFSALILYLHKSLYFEVPVENLFKRINYKNYEMACRRYRTRKVEDEGKREMSEIIAKRLIMCFNICLEECCMEIKNEIQCFGIGSLEDYQNNVNSLVKAITANLNCLNRLLFRGSSLVFPVQSYLHMSHVKTLHMLTFLDERRPDVFPRFSKYTV